jgi:diguanylate cyclase (GGDEF)-like protein
VARTADDQLSDVLAEFARTMATDFPIQAILDHLVLRIVDVLPVDAAGVTLISPGTDPRYVAASDASALRFEELQTTLGEGPCVAVYESGLAIAIPDLRANQVFPVFGPLALAAGMIAVFTFPLRDGDGQLGALDLYSDTPGALDAKTMEIAQTLADVAAAYLVNARTRAELVRSAASATEATLHDPLTGLPNRLLFMDRLRHAIGQCDRAATVVTVLYVDLDDFKATNDAFGHQAGDALLCAVADRLVQHCRPTDTVARLAGDEFAVLYEHRTDDGPVGPIADRLRRAFLKPFRLGEVFVDADASIGVAFTDSSTADAEQLLDEADMAMYQAKRRGGAQHTTLDHAEHGRRAERAALRRDLHWAAGNGEISSVYQPIVTTDTGRVDEVEALLRWNHPTRGSISPEVVVELAEPTELIHRLGRLMLTRACLDRQRWAETGSPSMRVAVNVSAHELMSAAFARTVADILSATDTEPSLVTLEVTETALASDTDRALSAFRALKQLGVRIALDDFGTGYSSLSYLARFPIDVVKVDRSFVAGLGVGEVRHRIVDSVIALAHRLGMTAVAEGVETAAQRDTIVAMGADAWQGFLFAPGRPAAEIEALLAEAP